MAAWQPTLQGHQQWPMISAARITPFTPYLFTSNVPVSVQGLTHSHRTTPPTVSTEAQIDVGPVGQLHRITQVTVSEHVPVTAADLNHTHTIDDPVVALQIAMQGLNHAHTLDDTALSIRLGVSELVHAHRVSQPTPTEVFAPVWSTIPNFNFQDTANGVVGSASNFVTGTLPITYADIGVGLPAGLTLDVNTGDIIADGPTTVAGSYPGQQFSASNQVAQDVPSNVFTITIQAVAPPGEAGYALGQNLGIGIGVPFTLG